jgi:hypothetical protein
MLKSLLSSIFCVTTCVAGAQITITVADMPNVNDSILLSISGSTITDPEATDTNYFWDFSMLEPTIQRYEKFDGPLTFTSPFNLIFNPATCSYGKDNYQLTTLPIPGITLDDAYDFMKESPTTYRQVGAGYTINGNQIPFFYGASDTIYRFPMDYGNIDSCRYKFGLPIPGIGFYGQRGQRINVVDGWGTVLTPYGSYDALRVKSIVYAVDTIYIDMFGFGTNIIRPPAYQYKWMANGEKVPVMEIDGTDAGGGFTVTNIQYTDSLRSDVPHVGIAEANVNSTISAFPNPADEQITVHMRGADAQTLRLYDISGRLLRSIDVRGKRAIAIDRDELSSGIYFLQVESAEGTRSALRIVFR